MRGTHFRLAALIIIVTASLTPAAFGEEDPAAPATTNVRFNSSDGHQLTGYLALPAGTVRGPAVLMIHEWWGLNRDITVLADALARQGYVVLAADTFRGRVARTAAEASRQVSTTPGTQIAADLDAALEFLKRHPRVDSSRVGVLGFCFGGTQAMRMGTRHADLKAVVIFYGSGPITDPQELGVMKEAGPVLGIYGAEDRNIPVSQVEGFRRALEARGVVNDIRVYDGVGHAFVKSTTYQDGGTAERAWSHMTDFPKRTL